MKLINGNKPKVLVFAPNYMEFLTWVERKNIIHSRISTMTYETNDEIFQYCSNPLQVKAFDKYNTQIFLLREKFISKEILNQLRTILNNRPLKRFQESVLI